MRATSAYGAAGVDLGAGNRAVEMMGAAVRSTYGPEVLLGIGAYGGLYDASRLRGMRAPVLVASTDGVGTRRRRRDARFLRDDRRGHREPLRGRHPRPGRRAPLFPRLYRHARAGPTLVARVVGGVAAACRAAGCALLGGETAEMPDVYAPGELDLVGTVIGLVERDAVIDGATISAGDVLLGLPSAGLHTNGFSLVRRIFRPEDYARHEPDLGRTLGEALLEPHLSYLPHVRALRGAGTIKGLAHLTGGGFVDNLPRILPEGLAAVVERDAWETPPLFARIEAAGGVDHDEMYRVFNMGIGMVVMVAPEEAEAMRAAAPGGAYAIGRVAPQGEGPRVVLA